MMLCSLRRLLLQGVSSEIYRSWEGTGCRNRWRRNLPAYQHPPTVFCGWYAISLIEQQSFLREHGTDGGDRLPLYTHRIRRVSRMAHLTVRGADAQDSSVPALRSRRLGGEAAALHACPVRDLQRPGSRQGTPVSHRWHHVRRRRRSGDAVHPARARRTPRALHQRRRERRRRLPLRRKTVLAGGALHRPLRLRDASSKTLMFCGIDSMRKSQDNLLLPLDGACTLANYTFTLQCKFEKSWCKLSAVSFLFTLCVGDRDDFVEWPFAKQVHISILHPTKEGRDIQVPFKICPEKNAACLKRPQSGVLQKGILSEKISWKYNEKKELFSKDSLIVYVELE
ncbi:hypothetical protein V5799_012598 [Amblyomma americanum]|uniref:TRAF1-6 MATH domain-containing protein n=1 Tax=Amblyomma americanum TaxID=6943 RepID=A0AAQ4EDM8_AMBAM